MRTSAASIFSRDILKQALVNSLRKLHPRFQVKNPVMFVTECCACLTTIAIFQKNTEPPGFTIQVSLWLWFTVLFANFAEAVAEGRGKAQADSLRKTRSHSMANRLAGGENVRVPAEALRKNDLVAVSAGELIPADGEVISGIATVDESAITGESAPVIRESGGDRSAVTGGTKVLSDRIVVRVMADPG
jgi:K+-transporting ATPase ATPase B chain